MKTSYFQDTFKRIVVDGSCHGVDLLGVPYFQMRRTVEVRTLKTRERPRQLMCH
jgi:hypothetical protein